MVLTLADYDTWLFNRTHVFCPVILQGSSEHGSRLYVWYPLNPSASSILPLETSSLLEKIIFIFLWPRTRGDSSLTPSWTAAGMSCGFLLQPPMSLVQAQNRALLMWECDQVSQYPAGQDSHLVLVYTPRVFQVGGKKGEAIDRRLLPRRRKTNRSKDLRRFKSWDSRSRFSQLPYLQVQGLLLPWHRRLCYWGWHEGVRIRHGFHTGLDPRSYILSTILPN